MASESGRKGWYDDAEKQFRAMIHAAEDSNQPLEVSRGWYDFACTAAVTGRRDEAIHYLYQSVDVDRANHFSTDAEHLLADPDFTSLHGDPRFDALVAEARENDNAEGHQTADLPSSPATPATRKSTP